MARVSTRSDDSQEDGDREKIPGFVATFGPDDPLIIGADGEYILRQPSIVVPEGTIKMRIMYAEGIPLNRLGVYRRKFPNSSIPPFRPPGKFWV